MATASSSGTVVRDDRCRNLRVGDSSESTTAMANKGPPNQENHEYERFFSTPSVSFYHSARIQRMIDVGNHQQSETIESSTVQTEIEASKVTWSELDNATMSQTEYLAETNQKYFEFLKCRKYGREASLKIIAKECTKEKKLATSLFRDFDTLIVGEKLAEGGQAEIYAASWDITEYHPRKELGHTTTNRVPMVVKVFKAGSLLSDLEKQWHPALLKHYEHELLNRPYLPSIVEGATLLKDERLLHRFAFVMPRQWGDLRKLIDHQMIHESHNRGPPFPLHQISTLMYSIARQMSILHGQHPPILHRDLKAANVLVSGLNVGTAGSDFVHLADFECSVGVVGTGFWRAPEIHLQLEHRDPNSPLDLKFTDKCDVYSYGMTCYEIVTGRIPFEDCSFHEACELVLNGVRPELPMDLVAWVKNIIVSCWHAVPSDRPSFKDIEKKVLEILKKSRF